MLVLAIDTSGTACSAALHDAARGILLAEVSEEIGRGHAERLMAVVDAVVAAAGVPLSALQRIAVTVGPGSFTGIRTGVAAARGLALALDIPCVGVSTLAVVAETERRAQPAGETRPLAIALDAKRGEVYLQIFDAEARPLTEPAALTIAEAADAVRAAEARVAGSGAALLTGGEAGAADRLLVGVAAELGSLVSQDEPPKPLYLRGPDAKPQTGFALARA